MILAAAGLRRLGLDGEISEVFTCEQMVPAPTQGILGIETPADTAYGEIWRALDDPDVRAAADAERAFVLCVGADCRTAAGCWVSPSAGEAGQLRLTAMVCTPDGTRHLSVDLTCNRADAVETAQRAASDMLARGAREIIEASAAG